MKKCWKIEGNQKGTNDRTMRDNEKCVKFLVASLSVLILTGSNNLQDSVIICHNL